ncbi:hypothetical protein BD309DRAFT_878029 [Dichomitus squalens]|nr:hypothetical protein BD309DRAFT_878029 [Dichomitus squalens]
MDKPEQACHILAIVPHGGGQRFILEHTSFPDDVATFLRSLCFGEEGTAPDVDLQVFAPVTAHRLDRAKKFTAPWAYFLEIPPGDTLLRPFLLWQEVFAVHTTLLFSVHDVTVTTPLWSILVLTGTPGAVMPDAKAIQEILVNIKNTAWTDGQFCNLVTEKVEKNWGHTGDYASRVKAAMDTLDLVLTRGESHGSEQVVNCYVLLAKPISNNRDDLKIFKRFLAAPGVYWRGPYTLEVNRVKVECRLCKDVTHCMVNCPLPGTQGWQGTLPATLGAQGPTNTVVPAPTLAEQAQNIWCDVPKRGGSSGRGHSRGSRGPRGGAGAARGRN